MVTAGYCPNISRIELHILDGNDNVNMSAVSVINSDSFTSDNRPIRGGIYDNRMGSIVNNYRCATCGHDAECPGHFGVYDVGNDTPVLQPIAQEDLAKWLKVVCLKCGTLMVDPAKLKNIPNSQKLQHASTLGARDKICPTCKEKHPQIKVAEENIFYISVIRSATSPPEIMRNDAIWSVLQKISDETCTILGRSIDSHPRKYYFTKLLIPPITIRPNFKNSASSKNMRSAPVVDFIKHIIKKSKLKESPEEHVESVLYITKCFYDMIRGGGTHKRGDPARTLSVIGTPLNAALIKALGGKKGRIRSQLLGHRALNTARITISGSARLEIQQLGVPIYVATTLQIPEVVRNFNIKVLTNYVTANRCSKIKKYNSGGKFTDINSINKDQINLEYGDVIYRNVMDGDKVVFNRQPSLIYSSMSAMDAVVLPFEDQNTFQINVNACIWFNADFDGDQMNAKALTSQTSIAEAKYLTAAARWMLSSQHGGAVNGQVQDAVVGSALFTQKDTVVDRLHAMRLFVRTGIADIKFDKESYTGREILSMLLTRTPITYKGTAAFYKEGYKDFIPYENDDINVVIEKGVIKSGVIDKATIGENSHGGIFHLIALTYGTDIALRTVFQYQQIIMAYLYMRGFTMSLSDLILPKQTRSIIDRTVTDRMNKSNLFAYKLVKGQVYPPMGLTVEEYYEEQQMKILGGDTDILGPILTAIDKKKNGLYHLIIHGAKGKPNHLVEMMGSKGSVTLEGRRMPLNFSPYRSSNYFPRFALNPVSRGFVRNPLTEGLNPDTMGFSAQSARQQVVQKSQSTALTGANQRKHVKNMENAISNNLIQIKKSHMLIQFLYGEDGFDPKYLINETLDTVYMGNNDIADKFGYKAKTTSAQELFDGAVKQLIKDRDHYRSFMNILDITGLQYKGYTNKFKFVLYSANILDTYFGSDKVSETDLIKNVKIVKSYIDDLGYIYSNPIQREKRLALPEFLTSAIFTTQMLLRIKLNPKQLQYIKYSAVDGMMQDITTTIMTKLIPPGSCVGVQAAQALGEPMTQAMLDAVHGASSGARAGLESIKEILGARYALPETNGMWIRLKEEYAADKSKIQDIADKIKRIKIEDIQKAWQIFIEDFADPIHPLYKHEKKQIEEFVKTHNKPPPNLTRWVIRFEIDKKLVIYKSISVETIVEQLYKKFNNIYVVYTTELDNDIVIRIYIGEDLVKRVSSVELFIKDDVLKSLLNLTIRGIDTVLETKVQPLQVYREDTNGALKPRTEYVIKTIGQDVKGIVSAGIEEIDMSEIQISTVMSTLEVFGIEAARIRIIEQLMSKMEGKHPDYHHLSIYADIITWAGTVKSIERAAVQEKNKTLTRMSGYAAGKILMGSALQGVNESTDSVSAPVMLGSIPRIGTNYNEIILDEEKIKRISEDPLSAILGGFN